MKLSSMNEDPPLRLNFHSTCLQEIEVTRGFSVDFMADDLFVSDL